MKRKILIVDDAPENIDFLVGILKNNYKIVAARDGEKALKLASSSSPPDLILLDIMMPGIDGLEVCRLLRKSEQQVKIPILFITGKSDEMDIQSGLQAGGDDFVIKPFNAALIQCRVATHLELYQLRKESNKK